LLALVETYCPWAMLPSFYLHEGNWQEVLSKVAAAFSETDVWILKPSLLNNGQHIHLFSSLKEVAMHYRKKDRLGGEHVLQLYLTEPDLLRDSRKYSVRLFVVLTNYAGAFLYPEGYLNVATCPFTKDYTYLSPHLTNEHLYGEQSNVIQIPTRLFANFSAVYQKAKEILVALFTGHFVSFSEAFGREKEPRLAILGMDFIVDKDGRAWLLEANHGPCFPVEETHPLQAHLYHAFWRAFIVNFVLPITKKTTAKGAVGAPFERLNHG
jgi:tubulin--tyrosine ligase